MAAVRPCAKHAGVPWLQLAEKKCRTRGGLANGRRMDTAKARRVPELSRPDAARAASPEDAPPQKPSERGIRPGRIAYRCRVPSEVVQTRERQKWGRASLGAPARQQSGRAWVGAPARQE